MLLLHQLVVTLTSGTVYAETAVLVRCRGATIMMMVVVPVLLLLIFIIHH